MGHLAKGEAGFVRRPSAAARYGVAVVSVVLFVTAKLLLAQTPIPQSPFLLLSAAVMVAAWFGGLGPGLLATALATAAGDYFFWSPFGSFTGPNLNALPLALFALQGVLISALAQALRSATTRAESSVLEAKSHRAALQESERRFRALVQNSSDVITIVDAGGAISYVSPAVESVTGYRPEELVGKSVFDHVHPDELEQGRSAFAEIWSQPGIHPPFELRVPHKDGSWRQSEFILNNLLDDPSVGGVVINQRDTTERREAEEALSESEERHRAVVEQSAEGLYLVDGDTKRILETNPALQNMLGYTAAELRGMGLHEIVAHDRETVEANVERTLRDGTRFIRERKYLRKDGSVVEVEIAASAIDYGGKRVICAAIRDITERRKAEKQLRESEELHRKVVEQAAENIFIVDAETKRVLEANAAFYASLGYAPEERERLTLYDIVDHDPGDIDRNSRRILEGHRFTSERRYRRKDGSVIEVEVSASSLSYGGREAMCIVAHDVTERKGTEEALRRSLDALLALYETGQLLGSSLAREEIALRLLEIAQRIFGLTAVVIALPDRQLDESADGPGEVRAWRSVGPEEVLASVRDRPEAEAARREVLKTGGRRHLELGAPPGSTRLPGPVQRGRLTGLFLPLLAHDRVIGVLEAYGPGSLAERETSETLASLASQAASALENARLYEELSEREGRLQDLVGRMMAAQEEERRRVAYDVHDGLTQLAVAAHQRLEMFAEDYPPGSAEGREELEGLIGIVRMTVGEARRVIADLRPTALDDFGLAAAVRMQLDNLRADGYEVGYEEALGEGRIPAVVETALFRIVQEALANARKHARADRVSVALERRDGAVRLEVRDWGRGFDPAQATVGGGPGERVGLSSMRERVGLLGGDLEILSKPGEGTSVVAEVPLAETETREIE